MKRRGWKWTARITAAGIAILLLGIGLLHTPPVQRFAFNRLRALLHDKSKIDIEASYFRFNLFTGKFRLENLQVRSAAAPEMPPIFRAARIAVQPKIRRIAKGFWDFDALQLTSPKIHYFVAADGKTNVPRTGKGTGRTPDYYITYAEVQDGSFQYEDLRDNLKLSFPRWRLRLYGDGATREHRLGFSSQQPSSFMRRDLRIPIDRIKLNGNLKQTDIRLDAAYIAAIQSELFLKGAINNFTSPRFDLHLTPRLDLRAVAQAAGASKPIRGTLEGTVHAEGKIRDLRIDSRLEGSGISAGAYRNTAFTLQTRAVWNPERVLIQGMEVHSSHGSLRADIDLALKPEADYSRIEAKLDDFDLFHVWQLLRPPFDLASRSSGNVLIRWTGPFSPSKLAGRANVRLRATRDIPGPDLLPLSGTVEAQLQPGRISGNLGSISALGGRVSGPFALKDFKEIEGDFSGDAPDLDILIAQVSKFLGASEPPLGETKISGPVEFNAKMSGDLTRPSIEFASEVPELSVGAFKHLGARIEASVEGTQIAFQSRIKLPRNSAISAKGTLDFGGRDPILNLDAYGDRVPAGVVTAMLDSEVPVSGELKTELHLQGIPDALTGDLLVTGDALTLYREPLGHLEAGVHMDGKVVRSTHFRLMCDAQIPDSDRIDGSFEYNFESDRYRFEAQGKDLQLSRFGFRDSGSSQSGSSQGGPIQGAVNLTASGSGTLVQPSVDLKIESADLKARAISLGPVSLTAALRDERLAIDAVLPRFNLTSSARVTNQTPYAFDAEMRFDHSDLSRIGLKAANAQPLTGVLDATVTGSGNLKNAGEAVIAAQVRTLQLLAGDREVSLAAPALAEYRDNSLEIRSASFVSRNSTLELAGRLPLRQPAPAGELSLTGQIDIAQATGFISMPKEFSAGGVVDLKLFLAGTPQKLSGSGTIVLREGSASLPGIRTPLSGITLRARVNGDTLLLEQADASWGQGRIALKGELPFGLLPKDIPLEIPRKQGPARFTLDLTGIRPEASGLLPNGMSGLVSLHAAGEASGLNLRALNAALEFQDLSFKMSDIALSQTRPSRIELRNGVASISMLSFTGTGTSVEAYGSAGILPDGNLNLRLRGDLNASLLTFRNRDLKAEGILKVATVVSGKRNAPSFMGLAEMKGGRFTLRDPRVVADSLSLRLALSPEQITVGEFTGNLNGGPMSVTGKLGYGRTGLHHVDLKATVQDFFFNFPEGLKSSSSGDLTLKSVEDFIEIGGTVRVQESAFRESFDVGGRLMGYLKSRQIVQMDREPDPLLERIRLNMALRTENPMLVQNNAARLEATANLRLVGSFQEPSVLGRITLNDGGEIILNQRSYYISRGTVNFTNQARIEPQLDIQAQTEVSSRLGSFDITLRLTGTAEKLTTTLTSDPPLAESEIISLLLTGKTREETRGQGLQIARTQALSLIAGQAGEELTNEARRALRLSTFRIDPGQIASEIASESDQGARLTIGEDITSKLSLAYSMNLTDGGDQIWAAQYAITRRFTTQATKQQDNTYRFEFNHNLLLGGTSGTRRTRRSSAQKFEIGAIRIEGVEPEKEKSLLDKFSVKSGQKYDFPKIQKGLDRLERFYLDQGRLEATVRLQRETLEKTVDLKLHVEPGPAVAFQYEGITLPAGVKEEVEKAWKNGVFDIERLEDAVQAIRMPLLNSGFLQSEIAHEIAGENEQKTVIFRITPGERFAGVPLTFPGASRIAAAVLKSALDQAGLAMDVYTDPQKVADFLQRYYRDRGYLQARVQPPAPKLDPKTGTGQVSIRVDEGPLFLIGELEFTGNRAFEYDELWAAIPTSSGSSYDPDTLNDSVRALENVYHRKGYNDVAVTYRVVQNSEDALANLTFHINERRQSVIRDLVIEGMQGTSRDFVERQLDFRVGDALDFARIDESRRRLYTTAVYSAVDIQTEELPPPASEAGASEAGASEAGVKDVRVRLRVREIRPYRLQYGLLFDTERGLGGLVEAQNRNFLGQASDLGLKLRYDSDLKEGRVFFYQPFVTKIHIKTDASAFFQRETRTAFSATRIGFSLFQERPLPRQFRLDYGYRYDHVRWKEGEIPPDPTIFQSNVPVARLIATVARDTRDSVLDATRGEFSSHSFEFGPKFLGSEIGFMRYYGQYFRYVPLDKFIWKSRPDKDKKAGPPRLVYAGALRLGLTSAFGGKSVISPERFFAGGGTTMRGFEQDKLGPLETLEDEKKTVRPVGGEALLLFNNELRFPIYGMLHGAGFLDIGNVYPRISDFNFNVRKSAGVGLRLKIKFIPLRFDYGFILDRRSGEKGSAYFFSIGQAF